MRQLLVVTVVAGAVLCAGTARAADPASPKSDVESEKAIRKLYTEYTTDWNKHDVPAMVNMWVADGDHVDPDGRMVKGRKEIEKLLTLQHTTVFKKSKLKLTVDSVWFISSNVALVDGSYELTGGTSPDGKAIGPRKGRLTSIFLHEGQRWWIAASRLMIPAPLPWREAAAKP